MVNHNAQDAPHTTVTLDLNSKMLDMATELGMDISEVANRLLALEVERLHRGGSEGEDLAARREE